MFISMCYCAIQFSMSIGRQNNFSIFPISWDVRLFSIDVPNMNGLLLPFYFWLAYSDSIVLTSSKFTLANLQSCHSLNIFWAVNRGPSRPCFSFRLKSLTESFRGRQNKLSSLPSSLSFLLLTCNDQTGFWKKQKKGNNELKWFLVSILGECIQTQLTLLNGQTGEKHLNQNSFNASRAFFLLPLPQIKDSRDLKLLACQVGIKCN